MTDKSKEVIERLNLMQERCCNGYDAEAINLAIKAVEVVDKIKKAYINSTTCNGVCDCVHDILCEAYGSEKDCESWMQGEE